MTTQDAPAATAEQPRQAHFPTTVATSSISLTLLVGVVGILAALDIAASLAARHETRLLSMRLDQTERDDSNVSTGVARMSYGQVTNLLASLPAKATAQETADVLIQLGGWSFPDEELERIEHVEAALAAKLRDEVKTEVTDLHRLALKSASYSAGHENLRQAGAALAMFPLSDDPTILKEAEDLSAKQRDIARRLELIRRQRYNRWAAGQVDEALRTLREGAKNARDTAVQSLSTIDPPLLEPAVASVYSYAIEKITDDLKGEKKASVAKQLTVATTYRRTLEDF